MRSLLCAFVTCLVLVGCDQPKSSSPSGSNPKETKGASDKPAKKYTRKEFKQMLIGKSEADVVRLIGKPDSTHDQGPRTFWYYPSLTYDPISGKDDDKSMVEVSGGVVVDAGEF